MTAIPVAAQETISAVVIDGYPDPALWAKEFTNFFIPRVPLPPSHCDRNDVMKLEIKLLLLNPEAEKRQPRKVSNWVSETSVSSQRFSILQKSPSQGIAGSTPFVASDARAVAKSVDEIAVVIS